LVAKAGSTSDAIGDWIERVAAFFAAEYGVAPTAGRILGWLMICDPAEQSGAAIAEAVDASPAALSTNMRLLLDAGFVAKRGRPGSRTLLYRVEDDAWESVVRRRVASLRAFRDLTADGIALTGGLKNVRARRLRSAYRVYDWMAKRLSGFDDEATSS
jgi:predicted transcriptional regulator